MKQSKIPSNLKEQFLKREGQTRYLRITMRKSSNLFLHSKIMRTEGVATQENNNSFNLLLQKMIVSIKISSIHKIMDSMAIISSSSSSKFPLPMATWASHPQGQITLAVHLCLIRSHHHSQTTTNIHPCCLLLTGIIVKICLILWMEGCLWIRIHKPCPSSFHSLWIQDKWWCKILEWAVAQILVKIRARWIMVIYLRMEKMKKWNSRMNCYSWKMILFPNSKS